jgi:hypothetical protein
MRYSTSWYNSGRYWTFDENGIMADDWYKVTSPILATAYTSDEGSKGTGWVYAENSDQSDSYWYYLVSITVDDNGTSKTQRSVPFYQGGSTQNTGSKYAAKLIKSKTYIFNNKGEMQDGLIEIKDVAVTDDEWNGITARQLYAGTYYFNEASGSTNGQMVTGKTTVTDDGETYYYYFDKSTGRAIENEVKDGVVYGSDGNRVAADDGNSNMIVSLGDDLKYSKGPDVLYTISNDDGTTTDVMGITGGSKIIVSSTGKLRTSGTVKIDGKRYYIESGVVNENKTEIVE